MPVTATGAGTPAEITVGPVQAVVGEVDAQGRTWLAWNGGGVARAARSRDDGAFDAPATLGVPGDRVAFWGIDLAVDDHGGAVVAYTQTGRPARIAEWRGPRDEQPREDEEERPGTGTPGGGGGDGGGRPGDQGGTPRAEPLPPVPHVRQVLSGLTVRRSGARVTVSFRVTVADLVRITVERPVTGRRSGARCVRTTARSRRAKPCRRWTRVTGRTVSARVGENRATLSLARLAPGRYRVVAATGRLRATRTLTVKRSGRR